MKRKSRALFIVSYLFPAIALYGVFVIYPLIQSLTFSFYRWRGVSQNKTYVGTENYERLTADPVFWQALKNNLLLLIVGGAVIIVIALPIAHATQSESKTARVLRGIYLFPNVTSLVAVAILWMFIYNPSFGILANGLKSIGLKSWAIPWLGDSKWALPAVGVAFIWYIAGFYIMLFAAGLRSIPQEINEAANLDGAIGFKKFKKVSWPMLWSIKRIAIVYLVINVMNVFALVYLMTQGGPDRKTEVMLTYLYEQAFKNSQFGYSTSLATANFIIVMSLSAMILFAFRKNPMEAKS